MSNGDVTASLDDQPHGEQPVPEQAGPRPWPAPGPDAGWWHGPDAPDPSDGPTGVPPSPVLPPGARRPSPARHRGRRALPPPSETPVVVVAPPPIWEPDDQSGTDWPARPSRAGRRPQTQTPQRVRPPRATRHPLAGLVALVLLGLLATFFAWFSAEPLWLSLGHGVRGTATVATCRVHGIAKPCADFTADGGAFVATQVTLLGTGPVPAGGKVPARMVSATASAAYTGGLAPRWVPSLLAVLLCGFGIAWLTGAYRLPDRRARLVALALSLAGPLLLTAGMLAATW